MRSAGVTQAAMFSYRTLEERIPREHPLRKLRSLVDSILVTLHAEFETLYAGSGRPSIPPERLLRASLIQTLHTIRSERQLVQHIEYNLLYRWFVGLEMDDAVWDHSSFTKNRERLLNETVARAFFGKVLELRRAFTARIKARRDSRRSISAGMSSPALMPSAASAFLAHSNKASICLLNPCSAYTMRW